LLTATLVARTVPDRPTKSISVEDTFEKDVPLAEMETDNPTPCRKSLGRFAQ
jgi:hypothetical protein